MPIRCRSCNRVVREEKAEKCPHCGALMDQASYYSWGIGPGRKAWLHNKQSGKTYSTDTLTDRQMQHFKKVSKKVSQVELFLWAHYWYHKKYSAEMNNIEDKARAVFHEGR